MRTLGSYRQAVGTARRARLCPPYALQSRRVGWAKTHLAPCPPSTGYAHRQRLVAAHEAGINPLRLVDHLDLFEPLEDLLPDDFELQFGKAHADAAVDAEAEGEVGARPRPVDDEGVGIVDHFLVAVAGDV